MSRNNQTGNRRGRAGNRANATDLAKRRNVYSSRKPGRLVCKGCGQGYGSACDGLCSACRGCSVWEAKDWTELL